MEANKLATSPKRVLRTEDELGKRVGASPLARLLALHDVSELKHDVAKAAETEDAA